MSFNNFFNDPFFSHDPFANDPFFNQSNSQNAQRRIGGPANNQLSNFFGQDLFNMNHGFNDHFFGGGGGSGFVNTNQINIQTNPDHYLLTLEIYNLDKTSIDLHVDPNTKMVSISGSVTETINQNGFQSVSSQSFSQSVSLPSPRNEQIDDRNVKITYENNVLSIVVPRTSVHQLEGGSQNTNNRYIADQEDSDYEYIADSNKIEEV